MDGMRRSKGKSICIDWDDVHIDLTEETGMEHTFGIHTGVDSNEEPEFVQSNVIPQTFECESNKDLHELTEADVFLITFNSESKGEIFYNNYAKVVGFSIQKDLNVKIGRAHV